MSYFGPLALVLVMAWACLLTSACAPARQARPTGPVPPWVQRTPTASGRLYAVGIVGPTYYPENGRRNAAEAARIELAHAIGVRVQSVLVDIERSQGASFVGAAGVVSVSTWATDLAVNGSQILEYWVDAAGQVPHGEIGATYALAVLELATLPADIRGRVPSGLSTGQADSVLRRIGVQR